MAGLGETLRDLAHDVVLRTGPGGGYADADDRSWMAVDWRAMLRREEVLGREVTLLDSALRGADGAGAGPPPGREPGMAPPAGRPILFVHGLGGLWQNWLLNLAPFMAGHRVVAPDLPGFGGSAMPAEEISIRGYARILDELCDVLGIDDPIVVGNSMGGFVGAELALSFPTRVAKLVLVSAAGLSIENRRREPLLFGARLWLAAVTRAGARSEAVVRRPRLRRAALQTVVRYPERLSGPLAWELVQGAGTDGFMDALEALMGYSFRDRLEEIEVPTLIVWGRNDLLVPVADAEEFERLIGGNARKVVFEDTGHMAMLERPARFNALLHEFVAGDAAPESEVAGVSRS